MRARRGGGGAGTFPSRTRLAALLPWALLAAYLAGALLVASREWRPEWDGAVYLLTAGSLAAGEGYSYQGEPFFLRPPGLPWMLSFLVEGRDFDPWHVHLLLHTFAGLAVAAIFVAVRALHGPLVALAVALSAGTSASFTRLLNSVFAEFPFAALLFAAIAAFHAAARPSVRPGSRSWAWSIAGALALSVAIHVRTVGVLLLPGVVLLFALRWRRAGRLFGLLPALAACACSLPWWLHAREAAAAAEVPSEQFLLHDYRTALLHADPGDPSSPPLDLAGWRERIASNGVELLEDLVASAFHAGGGGAPGAVLLALVLLGAGVAVRRRGPSLFEWFFLAYAVLLLTYFTHGRRLFLPLVPLVYLYLLCAVSGPARWLGTRIGRPAVGPAAVVLASLLLLAENARLFARHARRDPELVEPPKEAARWIRENTAPDARILCAQAPVMALLSGRRTFTFRFLRSRDVLAKHDIDYVLFDSRPPPSLEPLVLERHEAHWTIDLGPGGRATVVRVRSP